MVAILSVAESVGGLFNFPDSRSFDGDTLVAGTGLLEKDAQGQSPYDAQNDSSGSGLQELQHIWQSDICLRDTKTHSTAISKGRF